MNFLMLMWSFIWNSKEWLELLEDNRTWIPEQDELLPLPNKHRTMWGD